MEIDSNLTALLRTLTMADPLTAPRPWETIPSENGASTPLVEVPAKSDDPIHQTPSITDATLVRLALQALQGIKASLLEIEEISDEFSSIRADNTYLTTPNFWYRSSSTRSLSQLLKPILHTGLKVYFLQEFVNYFLLINSSFSLVNQAFAASVKKLLEGYYCAFDTLSASVKLRRGNKNDYSGITLLEIYLHTEELRRYVESLANICFPKFSSLDLSSEDLNTNTFMDFTKFPKGADLLSYLYIHLRDSDPVHYGLLKYLFIQSFEPYCEFIKLWIYQASIDDPYNEFFLTWSNDLQQDKSQLAMERNDTSLPCFLRGISQPIIRSGQQLNVLMKLLSFCNVSFTEGGAKLENILPCGSHNNSSFLLNSLIFSKGSIEGLVSRREGLYKTLTDQLRNVLLKLDLRSKWVIPLHSMNNLTGDNLISKEGSMDLQVDANEEKEVSDISDESTFETQLENSSNRSSSSSCYYSEEEIESLEIPIAKSSPQILSACERLFSSQCLDYKNQKDTEQKNNEDKKPCEEIYEITKPLKDVDNQIFKCWPLGSLNKNPFIFDNNRLNHDFLHNEEEIEEELKFGEGFEAFMTNDNKYESQSFEKLGFTDKSYNLGANPIRNKSTWINKKDEPRDKTGFLTPFFDFSSVTNPSDFPSKRIFFADSKEYSSPVQNPPVLNSNTTESKAKDNVKSSRKLVIANNESLVIKDVEMKDSSVVLTGGAQWTESLSFSNKNVQNCDTGELDRSCDLPVDIVIDKCIVQEILLQYKYVSNFTIKLLVEGFDLHEHLLTLRRYHFMEIADWANSLVSSIFHKKWPIWGIEQKVAEIQGFLESALQRSSCFSDPYKERLFIYIKDQDSFTSSTSLSGLDIFDSLMLGYRVEWPVNIIVNKEALNIYAEIFCYLGQIRFALFSLTYTWSSIKDLIKAKKQPENKVELNSFIRLRQQIHHFVSTLQQYAHSQLSDVSWCKFQHSLENQVKDMLDLESMHMSYLGEALHICFLSAETKPIAIILRNILQCAIDLKSCLPTQLSSNFLLNFTEVSGIDARFQGHLKDLYVLYKNSPKHGELSLCRFWNYLDYNGYFSSTISRELGFFYF